MASLLHNTPSNQSRFYQSHQKPPIRSLSHPPPYSCLVSAPTPLQYNRRPSITLGLQPSAIEQEHPTPPVPKRRARSKTYPTSQEYCTSQAERLGVDSIKLNQHKISTISPSSSADYIENGVESSLISPEPPTPMDPLAPNAYSTDSSSLLPSNSNNRLPYSAFHPCSSSPPSIITPTSPLKVAFSSHKNHRYDHTTETTAFHDSSFENSSQTQPSTAYSNSGSPRSPTQQSQNESSFPKYVKIPMGAMSRASSEHNDNTSPHRPNRSVSLHQHHGNHSKIDANSVIPIHVRYVSRDLWVQVDLPRDVPVHKARDLILSKCRLTCMPPQAPSSTTDIPEQSPLRRLETERISRNRIPEKETPASTKMNVCSDDKQINPRNSMPFESSGLLAPINRVDGCSTPCPSLRSLQPSYSSALDDDESFNDQESIDDDEAELRAEALIADGMFPQSPPLHNTIMSSIIPDSDFQGFPSIQIPSSTVTLVHSPQQIHQNRGHQRQQHYSTSSSISVLSSSSGSQYYSDQQQGAALNQRQFKKLISYSSSHKYEAHNNGFRTPNDIGSKDSCSTRLGHIPGWSTYKGRQHSSAKQMVREFLDHEGKLVDCLADEESPIKETIKEECSAWKASFGLFWVAAGHWLDDSRLVSSYQLQPHCLLELQLRNNYIQLPPQGTGLNYYDHYAEGVLYKMSKKSGPVSKLTSNGIRDSAGVWKVSWVVLQGNRLLIYRKSKDTAKESIELLPPLTVTTTMVPDTTHHISMTMITISHTKDPNATKFCFRATSETESNNWVRIFNSLNIETLSEVPPFFSKALANLPIIKPSNIPPPLPPLPVNLPPISRNTPPPLPIKRRERYQSCSSIASKETSVVAGFRKGDQPVYPNERKRFHTTLCASAATSPSPLPSINPVLISNAAAVLSNLNQCFPMSGGIENCDNNIVTDVNRISRNRSVSLRTSGQISLKRDHFRTMSHASTSTLVGSFFNDGFNQLQHHSISRNGSLSSRHQYQFQVDANGSQRQKISTELGHAQRFRVRSMSSELSSQQTLLREYIQRSKDNSSDVPSVSDTPTSDFKEMHLPIEPQSQALLTFSNKRSSASPLYSGYIWMYIPNTQLCASNSLALSTPPTSKHHSISSSESSAPMSKSSSSSSLVQSQNSSTGLKSNICISKASGRYVRCFVVINSLGQFQWVEASKEHEDSDDHTDDQSVNPSFGIQLNPNPVAALQRPKETTHPLRKLSINEKPVLTGPAKGLVQVAMAHKLRLYFFCIKVSISSLSEVMVEMVDAPEADDKNLTRNSSVKSTSTSSKSGYSTPTPHSPPPSLTKKSPLRVNNRLSTPLAHQRAASAMSVFNLPVRSVSLQKPRPRSRTFTHTDGSLKKNNTVIWPSMSRLHERSMSVPMRQTPAFVAPTLKKDSSKTISALSSTKNASADIKLAPAESIELTEQISKRLLAKPQSLFLENRTRSSFSGSIRSRDSTQSDQSALQNDSAAAVISRHESLAKMLRRTTGTLYPSEEDVVAYTIGSAGALKEHPEASHDSKSQVLLLAQSLQKALGQSRGLLDDSAEGILEQEIKPTLHEITAKKRSSIHQQKNSANIEAARLKLVGGRMDSLVESHENTDSITIPSGLSVEMDGQMKESEREKEQEKALRQMAAEIMMQCPFLEKSETCVDLDGRRFVTLKGYTETEEAWKMLQSSLDRFLDGPIKDQRSALPPEDTLIPSYHAPRLPEIRLSEKAQNFLKAKDKAVAAVAAAALLHSGQALDTTPVVNTSATSIAAAAMAATATVTAIGTSISTAATNSMAKTCLSRTNTTASNASTIVAVGAGCSDIRTRRSATLAVFNRHSVPLATGIGYGPRSSFAESINDTEANPKKIERSSLPGCLLVSKSPRKNVIDTPKKVPRVRTESESGAKTLLSVVSSEMKYSHSRSGSGNMFMKQDVSSDYHPQKQQQHTTSGAVAHLKATGASLTRWIHLSSSNHNNIVNNNNSSISC